MKKYFYITSTLLIVIAMGSYVLIRANKNIPPVEFLSSATTTTATTTTAVSVAEQAQVPARQQNNATSTATTAPETNPTPTPNVTFSVAGNSYSTFAPAGSTIIEAMKMLASATNFSFGGKDYPSLGFFVESINGKKAEGGYSWILNVNGKLSGTGASETHLNAGDAIEWRYEKNY